MCICSCAVSVKYNIKNVGGKTVYDNDTYVVKDNTFLIDTTLSSTKLYAGKETRGHRHAEQEEVYVFTKGSGEMIIDGDYCAKRLLKVTEGDIVLVHKGCHHKVHNPAVFPDRKWKGTPLEFICILQGKRNEKR